jgi:pimeloyl-ACP methyl ester carboxylesterase
VLSGNASSSFSDSNPHFMATFILVHGAWLDASGWSEVATRLRAAGHTVVAADLPGHGADPTPLAGQTLEAYVSSVLHAVDAATEPVTLVGHSLGGITISTVAERRPAAVHKLVYMAAYLLRDGESVQQISATDSDSHVPAAMRPSADWSSVAIDPAMAADIFCNGCTAEIATGVVTGMRAEATAPFGTPLHLTEANFGRVARAYISTRQDHAVSTSLQDRMLAALPCTPILSIDTGHLPFLAEPDRVATLLIDLLTR